MTTGSKVASLVLASAIAQILSQNAAAADAPAAQGNDLSELTTIVVTAEKREESLQNVPMSVTAVTGNVLDQLTLHSFTDYAALVPGLSLVNSRPGLTNLTLRGQNAGGVGSTVAVYLDESPFGSSSALLNGSIISGDFDTWDLQRIEVLRGPQGTLYGANSEGGLLKFVTTAPELNKFSGAAELNGEGMQNGGNGGAIRAMVNIPLGSMFALRVSGFDQDIEGFLDDPTRGKKDVNDGHKYGGRASLLAQPVDSLSIRLTATTQQSKFNGTNQMDADPNTLAPVNGDLNQIRLLDEPSSFKYANYSATINWDLGPISILSNSAYSILNSDTVSDATNLLLAPGVTLNDALGGAPGVAEYLDNSARLSKATQEVRVSSAPSTLIEWQVGGYFTHEIGHLLQHLNGLTIPGHMDPFGASIEVPVLDSAYKEYAGFANVTVHFNSAFDLQAGGRYSKNEQTATESLTGLIVPAPEQFSTPSEGHVFTWSVAPRWHITDTTMLYGRAATGYRPGGPNALPAAPPPGTPLEYGSDKTTNFEVGIRSTAIEGLSIDFDLFHVNWKNIQLLEQVNNIGINGNGGEARSQGAEWTFIWSPVHDLHFMWTGAITDAKLTTPAPAVHGNTNDPLPYAPKYSQSLDGEYAWPAFADYKAFLGATWSFVGNRRTDFGSSNDPLLPTQVELKQYSTEAMRFGFDNNRYRATLYVHNLTDTRGVSSYVSSGVVGFQGGVSIIQPRTVGLTLNAKF
jgi:outer membrane receptor protein involved in Fe transport